jgi:hypothetical protein
MRAARRIPAVEWNVDREALENAVLPHSRTVSSA